MRKQYLHLSAYPCDACAGPVIAGSLAVRENEISKETDIRPVGAICLSCGHRQSSSDRAGARPSSAADGMGAGGCNQGFSPAPPLSWKHSIAQSCTKAL